MDVPQAQPLTPPPPDPPELPAGAATAPRWPPWYGIVGFLVALTGTLIVVGIGAAAAGIDPGDESSTFTIAATFAQDSIFVVTAVLFASMTQRPKAWHFGLRPTRLWRAVGWAALGMLCFYAFTAVYTTLVQSDAEQNVTQSLGADQGTAGLILAGIMIIVIAPIGEEVFFRGFFYRALRSRYTIFAAAAIDGLVFGLIHYDFTGADALLIIPPLAILGFIFCLVYEKTGSLYTTIALHAFNNAVAYGVQAHGWSVSAVAGPLMLLGCAVAPELIERARGRPAPALR